MKGLSVFQFLFLAGVVYAGQDERVFHNVNGFTIGSLLKKEINYGCGCSFYYPPQ